MVSDLKHIGRLQPKNWVRIREELESMKNRNFISFTEYAEICSKYEIVQESHQLGLCKVLNNLGTILYFDTDTLQDTVFLNPQWVVDAVYSILSAEEKNIKEANGRFSRDFVFKIWENKGYPLAARGKLLNLMLKDNFEICYKIEGKEEYIAPQLLSAQRPEFAWDETDNLKFQFQYPYMPRGIITRLIIKLSDFIEKQNGTEMVWEKGVVLSKEDNRAVITEELNQEGIKILNIKVAGDKFHRKELLTIIREEVLKIHKSFPKLPFEEKIPCFKCEELKRQEISFFKISTLENTRRGGLREIICYDGCLKSVSISKLIDSVIEDNSDENIQTEQAIYIDKIINYGEMDMHGETGNKISIKGNNSGIVGGRDVKNAKVTNTQITNATNDKEEQYLKALAELKEAISKLQLPEKENKELEKAITKIDEESKKEEPDTDVVEVKLEKAITILEKSGEIADTTNKTLEKLKSFGEKLVIYSPALTEIVRSVLPG